MQITTIGLDLAKRVFQVHGVDAVGRGLSRASSFSEPQSSTFLPILRLAW